MKYSNYIIDVFAASMTICLELLSIMKISKTKINRFTFKDFIIILFGAILLMINATFVDSLSRSFISIMIVYFCLIVITKKSYSDSFIYIMFCNLFIIIYEIIYSSIFTRFNILSLEMLDSNHIFKAIYSFINLMSVYLTCSLKPVISFIDNVIKHKRKYYNRFIFIILLLICVILIILNFHFSQTFSIKTYISNVLLSICVFVIIFIAVKNMLNVQRETEKTEILLNSMKKYEKIIDENRVHNHELLNNLLMLKSIKNKNTKEYTDLLNEFIDEYTNKGIKIKNVYKLPYGLKGIFYYKLYGLEDKGFDITLNVSNNAISYLKSINHSDYVSLYKIVGIILDNAVDASKASVNKYILVDIYEEDKFIIIEVNNSYKGKIDINKINEKNYSTKGDNRGLGLHIMNELIKNIDNIEVSQSIDNIKHIFSTRIIVNKNL